MPILTLRATLRLIDSLATTFAQAYQLARVRLASAASPVLRMMVQRDEAVSDKALLQRELAILRSQREQIAPHRRPEFTPEQRWAILQLKRMRGSTLAETSAHFVVHENTVRHWVQAAEGKRQSTVLTGAIVWNKIDDAVRWAIQELRQLCPEPEFGTRSMARQLLKAAVQISRSSVQRILREPAPEKPKTPALRKPAMEEPEGQKPYHLLLPKHANHFWHLDLTCVTLLWWTFWVAAVLDGYSRKFLALRAYCKTPRARDMVRLVRRTAKNCGQPRFVITDQGTQFRRIFHTAMEQRLHIHHVRCKVRAPFLNGKIERAFRSLKGWWHFVLTGGTLRSVQRRLDDYRHWYNEFRIHSALGVLTPQEAWDDVEAPAPIPIRAAAPTRTQIQVTRANCRGDPRLRVLHIAVCRQAA